MSDHEKNSVENLSETSKTANRRRFLKKGAMAAPIITTLASRPVWGGDGGFDVGSISGSLSGNLSNRTYQPNKYDGCSPGYWHKADRYPQQWGSLTIHYNTAFNTIFTNSPFGEGLTTIINGSTNPHSQVERFAGATFMNAVADPNFPYPPSDIVHFYHEYLAGNVSYSDAKNILENLVHSGKSDGPCFADEPEEDKKCNDDDHDGENSFSYAGKPHGHGKDKDKGKGKGKK